MAPRRPWLPFLIGILISTFVGGGIRVLLAPDVVEKWVLEIVEKNSSRIFIRFSAAKISLSQGWRPHFAIELSDVEVGAKDQCLSASAVKADRVVVPLQISSLFSNALQFGNVFVSNLDLRWREAPTSCREALYSAANEDDVLRAERFLARRWNKEVQNTLRYFHNLAVDSFRFFKNDSAEPVFVLQDVSLGFESSPQEGLLEFIFWPGFYMGGGQPFGPTSAEVRITSRGISWRGNSNLKEGQIHFSGDWRVDERVLRSDINWKDVPSANLVALFDRWQMVSLRDFNPRHQWSTCTLSVQGDLREWQKLQVQLSACEMTGDLGVFKFSSPGIQIFEGRLNPLQIDFDSIDLRRLAAAFSLSVPRILTLPGVASGQIDWERDHYWQIEGEIRELEVFFPLLDKSSRLPLGRSFFEWIYADGRHLGQIKAADSLGVGAEVEARFEREKNSDVVQTKATIFVDGAGATAKRATYFDYSRLNLQFDGIYDFFSFYNVRGRFQIERVDWSKRPSYRSIYDRVFTGGHGASGPYTSDRISGNWSLLPEGELFLEATFSELPATKLSAVIEGEQFESAKFTREASRQSPASVFFLQGLISEPAVQ